MTPRVNTISRGYPRLSVPSITGWTSRSLPTLSKTRNATARALRVRPAHWAFFVCISASYPWSNGRKADRQMGDHRFLMELASYLKRIGLPTPGRPDLDTLRRLHEG